MKRTLLVVLVLMALLFVATACSGDASDELVEEELAEGEHMEDEHMEDENEQQMDHMHDEPPDEFASLTNPLAGKADAISAGQEIFEVNCVTCHGPEGAGDGPGGVGLDPKPANLSDSEMMPTMNDSYLFWRVSKGGAMEPFNSAMPSWEQGLMEEQRWQVINYVRTLSEQ